MAANHETVGDILVAVNMLADAQSKVERFVDVFIWVYTLLVFLYILLSWFRLPYSTVLSRVQRFLYDVCEPYLRLFRRLIPPIGPVDISPVLALIVLVVLRELLDRLIARVL